MAALISKVDPWHHGGFKIRMHKKYLNNIKLVPSAFLSTLLHNDKLLGMIVKNRIRAFSAKI